MDQFLGSRPTASTIDNTGLPEDSVYFFEVFKKEVIPNLIFRFRVDNRGRVLDVEIDKKTVKVWHLFAYQLGESKPEQYFKNMLEQTLVVLPDKPLVKGATWKNTLEISLITKGGFSPVDVQYCYDGLVSYKNKELEKITTEATVQLDDDVPPGIEVKANSQENLGVIYFDNNAGRLVEKEIIQKSTTTFVKEGQTFETKRMRTSKVEFIDK